MDTCLGAKHDEAESRTANQSREDDPFKCLERRCLVEDLEFARAHPALFNDEANIGASDCCGQVKFDEILGFCRDIIIDIVMLAIFLKIISPLLWLRMDQFAKDEIEDCYGVEAVEDLGASIPCEFPD